jgi:predicted acetyltransferase
VALTGDVRLALLRFACELDLVGEARFPSQPVDEPLRWVLADPRRLVTTSTTDLLWLRLLDVPRCLSARRYEEADRLVIDVDDRFRPGAGGRFALDTMGDSAACVRTTEPPDLAVSASDLAALYLGGVSLRTLDAAGAVRELSPGAVGRASRMLMTDRPPYGDTDF